MTRHAASRPSDDQVIPVARRIANQIVRHVLELERFHRLDDAAVAAAFRVLADDEIAAGLRATATLAALDDRHQPRTWVGGHTVVCAACETAWPCRDRELLDGAQTPARPGSAPAGPGGLPTDEFTAVTA